MLQIALKKLIGDEVKSYADAHDFKDPAKEKRRCWRLNYQDDVSFHMDILPSIPDDEQFVALLVSQSIPKKFAVETAAITDKKHTHYEEVSDDWPKSNPRGFAGWFESRMKAVAQTRRAMLVANQAYASIGDVPPYEWKTPLQRSIQILKRHRDVMFRTDPDRKPISMIITTLSAHAYGGEIELYAALSNIVDRMPQFVRETQPRVPNPVNPAEDFADKWAKDSNLEKNFWDWHTQVRTDIDNLCKPLNEDQVQRSLRSKFDVDLSFNRAKQIATLSGGAVAAIPRKAPTVIHSAPKPWCDDA